MTEQLFGLETEYALSVLPADGDDAFNENCAHHLLELAKKIPHLRGKHSGGLFLHNGARFYVDCGSHPEFCTPECTNPWDACRYVQAGENTLLDLARQLPRRHNSGSRALIFRNNVDYTTGATWGCHESFLHRKADQPTLSRQIIPHLVSRIVFTGAGGFDSHSPGIEFLVSPRVAHLTAAVSSCSTGDRGIFHTRNEPLCGNGYRRLHLLCGESVCSETNAWLRTATTSLVVAMVDAGLRPGEAMQLAEPLVAMRAFAADHSCTHRARLTNGGTATVLEIQRHYLAQAEACAGSPDMPPWAPEACQRWRAVLDLLASGAAAAAKRLDWAIKLALFESHLRRRGTSLGALARWNPVLVKLAEATASENLTTRIALGTSKAIVEAREKLAPYVREHSLDWEALPPVLALRFELFEIDVRYGILGEGIFATLDRSGVLEHRVSGVDNIPHAMANPPSSTRASIRGAHIQKYARQNGRYACEWDGIYDLVENKCLPLADPFATPRENIQWKTERAPERRPSTRDWEQMFWEGRYVAVVDGFREAGLAAGTDRECYFLSLARLGRRPEALEALEALDQVRASGTEFHKLALKLSVLSNGLVPGLAEMAPLIATGDAEKPRLLEREEACDDYSRFIFLLYKGLYCGHTPGVERLGEHILTHLVGDHSNQGRNRMYARTRCYLAEVWRRQGLIDTARTVVTDIVASHRTWGLLGDLAEHSLPLLAKFATDDDDAEELLTEAESLARSFANRLSLARVLAVRARRLGDTQHRDEFRLLARTTPVLENCAVARKIERNWNEWIAPPTRNESLDYWGV